MELIIEAPGAEYILVRPVSTGQKNVESIIAKIKMVILESYGMQIFLDLTDVNFLDCIKIGTIVGTYHFLEFSGKKINIIVSDFEIKKALESLSFNNIEIQAENRSVLEGIA